MDYAIPAGTYQHFKGNLYEVIGTAKHSETEEIFVIYKTTYGEISTWIRPLMMFTEVIEHDGDLVPRFQLIKPYKALKRDQISRS